MHRPWGQRPSRAEPRCHRGLGWPGPWRPRQTWHLVLTVKPAPSHCDCAGPERNKLGLEVERKAMTNLDSLLKSRDITLPTKVYLVKAVVFPGVIYGCESWTIKKAAAAAAKSLQSCLTLCNPRDGSPPGSSVPGIHQARILEWVAVTFSTAQCWRVHRRQTVGSTAWYRARCRKWQLG